MNTKLSAWYASERLQGHVPSEIDMFNVKMLGSEDKPVLKTKAAEAVSLFRFVALRLLPDWHEYIEHGKALLECARPLMQW
eukprot:7345827-Pyramimonas_sp.AAC.1